MNTDCSFREIGIEQALKILQPDGRVSRLIEGYEFREQQQDMLRDIIDAYQNDAIALIEAGTGTGKSLAYLIPAILWAAQNKERTLISTRTITLQEQLLFKDIPLATKALGIQSKAVLVKGMTNYLCLRKLEDSKQEKRLLTDKEAEELEQIEDWSETTLEGSLSDLSFVPSYNTWERVCAEGDACNQRKCPFFRRCRFFKARREAEDAQILVANHSMLFADLAFQSESDDPKQPGLLPTYTRIILDEAHDIEDVATEFFADKVSYLQMLRFMGKLGSETQGKLSLLSKKIHQNPHIDILKEGSSIQSRLNIDLPAMRRELLQQISDTFQAFTLFLQNFEHQNNEKNPQIESKLRLRSEHLSHPFWKKEIQTSATNLIDACNRYVATIQHMESDIRNLKNHKFDEQTEGLRYDIIALTNRLSAISLNLSNFIGKEHSNSRVRWIEARPLKTLTGIQLIDAELDISKILVDFLFKKFPTIVLCSATMTTNRKFRFIKERLGILQERLPGKKILENIYPSPFDYQKQVMLIIPSDMPNPTDSNFTEVVCEKVWQAIKASKGNTFVLFTSYAMLQQCYEQLAPKCEENRFPVFKQGDDSRNNLLKQFKSTDYSVLFGTDSF
ncbi:MAG: ATP-dependent DNA helicase, partial [Waddliaceae bacterium]